MSSGKQLQNTVSFKLLLILMKDAEKNKTQDIKEIRAIMSESGSILQ